MQAGGNFPDGRQNVRDHRPLRMSGDLSGTPGIRLISPFAELEITSGVIVAQRHIHMSPLDALIYGVTHGDKVAVAIEGDERRLIFENVTVRVSRICVLKCILIPMRPTPQALIALTFLPHWCQCHE